MLSRMVYAVGVFMQRCRDIHRVGWSVIVIIRTYIPCTSLVVCMVPV